LVVIVILAILVGLLLPAINAALRTAKKAAVSAEISQIAQALASFKSKYGDYPPSRFLALEDGNYVAFAGGAGSSSNLLGTDPTSPGTGDITVGQLAQRSMAALRKFFPRVSTTGAPLNQWYDFNGNGLHDTAPYVLHGHECLVLFLGGIPLPNQLPAGLATSFGVTGFDKNPTNPFTNSVNNGNKMYSPNRQPPLFEFNAGRLFVDPSNFVLNGGVKVYAGVPGYYDSLGNPAPSDVSSTLNFYAYFSAYGNGAYDPNDVNFGAFPSETDINTNSAMGLSFNVVFPLYKLTPPATSAAPNPYTSSLTVGSTVTFQNAQSFQLFSSGIDGLYGVGGQFIADSASSASVALPIDTISATWPYINIPSTEADFRKREGDNLTNFKNGSLE
jgi:general secretion pathway protein G